MNQKSLHTVRKFKVAGHLFSLALPACEELWKELSQYEPFEVEDADNELFTLSVTDDLQWNPNDVLYDVEPEPGQTVIKVYSCPDGLLVEMSPERRIAAVARLWTDSSFRSARLRMEPGISARSAIFAINNSLMLLYAFATAPFGTLEMHASVILKDSRAYFFLGKSGTGKSTHSRLWLQNIPGSELMNDDNPVVRIMPDGTLRAFGSPWSGKTPCYRNVEAPVGAFVSLTQAPRNAISRLSLAGSYAVLYASSSGLRRIRKMADGLHETLAAAATSVPCYSLECLPDADAALLCFSTVSKYE